MVGKVLLDKNDTKDEILLVLHDIFLQIKDMNGRMDIIEIGVASGPSPSGHDLVEPIPIEVDASTSS